MKLCGFEVGNDKPIFLIAGTCVVESEQMALDTAATLKEICAGLGIGFIYKSSFDKANRSSSGSFRGPGMEEGLRILAEVKRQLDLPILTDVHEDTPMDEVAEVADVLQTPAFLCRQTNFILRAAGAGRPVNIKKGQFLSPWEMQNVVDKAKSTGNDDIMAVRWYSMLRIRCNYRVARGSHPVGNVSSFLCWPAQQQLQESPVCLWKRILILRMHLVMDQMPGRWTK
jgi:2-dehydro-3-deoxyphosphooctonate aldolase (KDO 8-P synthase)